MTQPEDSKGDAPSKIESAASAEAAAPKPETATAKPKPARKPAAKPGMLKSTETGEGDGSAALAGGGKIEPADSSLLGKAAAERPAATPRPEDQRPLDPAEIQRIDDAEAAKAVEGKLAPVKHAPEGATKPEVKAKPAEAAAKDAAQSALKDAAPKEVAPSAPAQKQPAQKTTVQKTGFWPVVLGGVVAAGLGSAATIWALPHLPAGWLPDRGETVVATPQVDVEAIRADAVRAVEARIADLRQALAASTPLGETPAVDTSALDQQIAGLRDQLEQQAKRIEELVARPSVDPDMAGRMQTLAAQAEALEQQIQTAAQQAQSRIIEAQVAAENLQAAAVDSTRRAEAVAAIASLQAALDRGVTPEEARATLEGAGMDAPDALTREVPSLTGLQEGFGAAARAALRAALREESASGSGNLLTNFLRAQTGARSVQPREGDDPDAILSRAGAEVDAGRIGAALDQMQALPETARAAPDMAAWLAGAESYRAAQAALDELSANSN